GKRRVPRKPTPREENRSTAARLRCGSTDRRAVPKRRPGLGLRYRARPARQLESIRGPSNPLQPVIEGYLRPKWLSRPSKWLRVRPASGGRAARSLRAARRWLSGGAFPIPESERTDA